MMKIRISFLFLFLSFFSFPANGKQIELFMDWRSDGKGTFTVPEGVPIEQLPLESRIRKRLLERGWDLSFWERDFYRPWLIGWSGVKSWQELKWRLGWGLADPVKKETAFWVFWSLGPKLKEFDFGRAPKEKLVLFIWEPPSVQPEAHDPKVHAQFGKIFTWDDDLVDQRRFFKFYYPVLRPRIEEIPSFESKKFCTLIARRLCSKHPKQLYSEREKTIRFFEDKPGEFDLYGFYWEKRGYKNYRGHVPDKIDTLKNYKFCICYENTRDVKGYVTEKIFDCFSAGSVPVYWGASNITDYIPEGCFIDRRKFADELSLYNFLKQITKEEYERYLECAAEFLKSPAAKPFSQEFFVETFLNLLN